MESEIDRALRYNYPFTIAYIDVDNFKVVNDTLGHSTGDDVLRVLVQTIKQHLRRSDAVARLGGDEFALVLLETGSELAPEVLQKVRTAVTEEMQKNKWPVTLSIGALTCMTPPRTATELLKQADTLMYAVKKAGKDSIQYDFYK